MASVLATKCIHTLRPAPLCVNELSAHFCLQRKFSVSTRPVKALTNADNVNATSSSSNVFEIDSIVTLSSEDQEKGSEFLSGPVELPVERYIDPFAIPEATPLQTAASLVLTTTIALLLFRSLQRRSARSKEMKFRSGSVEKVEPPANAPVEGASPPEEGVDGPPPTALNTLGGAVVAGAIAFVLYGFSVGVDGSFSTQTLSDNYQIRNISITVRTIVAGMSWLATFIFGVNSLGLLVYSISLAFGGSEGLKAENTTLGSTSEASDPSAGNQKGND